jgi:hypothetical protein
MPTKERKEAVKNAGGLGPPSRSVSDWIWLLIVIGFLATMIGAVFTLLQGRFVTMTPAEGAIFTSTETLITLFTTTTAFLAGLLAPSPVQKGEGGE